MLAERKKWLLTDFAVDFLKGVELDTGSDLSSQISTLQTEEIESVSELSCMSDNDFRELGFTIGLKNKIRSYLNERKAAMRSAAAND